MKINKLNFKKGFTLIELLVVVAIIGILASIIIVSLGNARKKGSDGAIKSEFNGLKSQTALYYSNNNNSYNNMFTGNNSWASTDSGISTFLVNLNKKSTVHTAGSSANGWAVQIRSVENTAVYFCMDTDFVIETSGSAMSAGATTCP